MPVLLKFRPAMSVVIIGAEAPRGTPRVTIRYDLPDPANPAAAASLARHATAVLAAADLSTAVAVGYGPDELVAPVAAALMATDSGVAVAEFLRVADGCYWSYVCANPECCSPAGTPVAEDTETATALAHADVEVLSSREDLAATVTADPEAATAMGPATRRAEELLTTLSERATGTEQPAASRMIARPGLRAVAKAIACYRNGREPLPHDDIALLTVMLRIMRVRDDAWSRMLPAHLAAHLRLWTDVTRLAQPGYVAAPATLLAFTAWQSGNGALANVALDRALADNPSYSMALLLRQALDSGAPPSLARLPMTPKEVAGAYDQLAQNDASHRARAAGNEDPCDGTCCGPAGEQSAEPVIAPATT